MRELQRVGEQIQYDALPHLPVHVYRRPRLIAANLESEACTFDRGPEDACDFGGCFPELYRLVASLNSSGLDSRKFKQRVDQLQQASGIAVNLLDLGETDNSWIDGARAKLFERAKNQRKRGAQFMADIAEKRRFGAIKCGEGFRAVSFLVHHAGIGHAFCNLAGDQIKKG